MLCACHSTSIMMLKNDTDLSVHLSYPLCFFPKNSTDPSNYLGLCLFLFTSQVFTETL